MVFLIWCYSKLQRWGFVFTFLKSGSMFLYNYNMLIRWKVNTRPTYFQTKFVFLSISDRSKIDSRSEAMLVWAPPTELTETKSMSDTNYLSNSVLYQIQYCILNICIILIFQIACFIAHMFRLFVIIRYFLTFFLYFLSCKHRSKHT